MRHTEHPAQTVATIPDPDAPPSAEELADAERFRIALEHVPREHAKQKTAALEQEHAAIGSKGQSENLQSENLQWVQAVRLIAAPPSLSVERHEEIFNKALEQFSQTHTDVVRSRPSVQRSNVRHLWFGTATALVAAAASVVLVMQNQEGVLQRTMTTEQAVAPIARTKPLLVTRSAEGLFLEKFPTTGGTTARVDRIAEAREHDLRENLFAQWGAP